MIEGERLNAYLVGYAFNLTSEELTLTFAETVNTQSFQITAITVHNNNYTGVWQEVPLTQIGGCL